MCCTNWFWSCSRSHKVYPSVKGIKYEKVHLYQGKISNFIFLCCAFPSHLYLAFCFLWEVKKPPFLLPFFVGMIFLQSWLVSYISLFVPFHSFFPQGVYTQCSRSGPTVHLSKSIMKGFGIIRLPFPNILFAFFDGSSLMIFSELSTMTEISFKFLSCFTNWLRFHFWDS